MPDQKPLDLSDIRKTTALLYSVGRTMLSAGAFCAHESLARLGMRPFLHQSAFWSQSLALSMRAALKSEARYIITADGDTVYDWQHIAYLWTMMETHPEADAIAALQCKRESAGLLMNVVGCDQKAAEVPGSADVMNNELVPATVAHFGLTIFRLEAMKAVPEPWFLRLPNPSQPADTIDEDIYFWRHWREQGRSIYIASRCPVGHVDEMIMWPGENFRTVIQSWANYRETNARPEPTRATSWELAEQQKAAKKFQIRETALAPA